MNTPIFDGLAAELNARLAGEGFWPDYFCIWVVCVDAAVELAEAALKAVIGGAADALTAG